MRHVKHIFNEASKHDRDNWKFIFWIHNETNGFEAASGPPSKIDGEFLDKFLARVKQFITSGDVHNLSDLYITVKGHYSENGGAISGEHRVDLFKKRSLIEIKNEGNSCFWHASIVNIHKNHQKITQIKDGRGSIRTKLAKHMCLHVGLDWDANVAIEDIPLIEEAINKEGDEQFQYCVLNIEELPHFNHTGSIIDSLMYKGLNAPTKIWLLFDHGHYHAISDIKKFLGVEAFCSKCFKGFYKSLQVEKHDCDINIQNNSNTLKMFKRKQSNKTCSFPKDRAHYLVRKEAKLSSTNQRYVIYDIEADATVKHIPNTVIVKEFLIPGHDNNYTEITAGNSLIASHTFSGYDCIDKFCEWLLLQPFESNKKQNTKHTKAPQ